MYSSGCRFLICRIAGVSACEGVAPSSSTAAPLRYDVPMRQLNRLPIGACYAVMKNDLFISFRAPSVNDLQRRGRSAPKDWILIWHSNCEPLLSEADKKGQRFTGWYTRAVHRGLICC
ncbi:hypothetical protein F5146DRAFT_54198 [Armillaria mellea]|nr:hypothetical protein F5146DRAFT_54198 [Armillaria mellea]